MLYRLCGIDLSRNLFYGKLFLIRFGIILLPVFYAFRKDRNHYALHLTHFFIVIKHGDAACQHNYGQCAAQAAQNAHRVLMSFNFRLSAFNPLSEISDHIIRDACFHAPHIFSQHHIVLHHLISFIINAVAAKLVKAVLRGHIDGFFPFQP